MIIEREKEIQNFKPEESWKVFAELDHDTHLLPVELTKVKGKNAALKTHKDIEDLLGEYGIYIKESNKSEDKKTGSMLVDIDHKHPFTLTDITIKE